MLNNLIMKLLNILLHFEHHTKVERDRCWTCNHQWSIIGTTCLVIGIIIMVAIVVDLVIKIKEK